MVLHSVRIYVHLCVYCCTCDTRCCTRLEWDDRRRRRCRRLPLPADMLDLDDRPQTCSQQRPEKIRMG